jgi:dephospho-CoA kinase
VSERWPDKTIIGLTGNIGTGKSVVRRMLEHLGAFGVDADGLSHRAMSPGAPAYQPVVDTFGQWLVADDGQIDRAKLGNVVFSDPSALERLEAITHPIVKQVVDLLIRRAKQEVVVVEAIKLIESGLAADCDVVWAVDAPEALQLQRLIEQRKMSEADARRRIAAQLPQADKISQAQVVINNDAGYEKVLEQVQEAYNKLLGITPAPEVPDEIPEPVVSTAPVEITGDEEIAIRRGTLKHAETIASFINTVKGEALSRADVIERFGQKAYMLAHANEQVVGLAGWQVENLITRVSEFYLVPNAPADKVVHNLLEKIEQASHDLQSEITLLFLGNTTAEAVRNAVVAEGYEPREISDLKVTDWREAAQESAPPDSYLLTKKLREDRVLKPL